MATIQIAQRVASEYDGVKQIKDSASVGYEVSYGNVSPGNRIVFMTENHFISRS